MNKKFAIAAATAALVMGVAAPSAFAATNVTIVDNGAFSDSSVRVKNNHKTVVSQSNDSTIVNRVNSRANSGGNRASFNTGGDSSVDTGNAVSNVGIVVGGSSNTANVENCDCDEDVNVVVDDNGAFSDNRVRVSNNSFFGAWQANVSNIFNRVNSRANSGRNSSSFNTGGASVETGNTNSSVFVEVNGSSNTLN